MIGVRRVALGVYLCVHFAMLLPYAAELFSSAGVLPAASFSPLHSLWPGLMHVSDSPAWAGFVVALGALAGAGLALDVHPRTSALVAWLVWSSLFCRNPLISNPGLPYVGLMLCMLAATPRTDTRLRRSLDAVLYGALALGYTYSGLTKLAALSWRDGSALGYVLGSPLARELPIVQALADMPTACMLLTYAALTLEILYVPLSCVPALRLPLWLAMVGMHLGLVLSVDFADLTLGMLLVHLFTLPFVLESARGARALP